MPQADLTALLTRRGKSHSFISVTPGTWSAATNAVTGGSEATIAAYGVYQRSQLKAVGGVAIAEGDEILLVESTGFGATQPKIGDAVSDGGSRRVVVGVEPVRGTNAFIWAWTLLLRGPVDVA